MNKSGVILTDGNERATLAVTRSLGRQQIPVFVGAEKASSLAARSRYCTFSFQYPSPWNDPEGYVSCILDAASKREAAVVLPMTDIAMELIGERMREFEGISAVPIPSIEQYHLLSDKYELMSWAAHNHIPIPSTIFIQNGQIDTALEQISTWPVVVKPGRSLIKEAGTWRKSAVLVARDANDLRRIYHEAWFLRHPSMIQQYIYGDGEGIFGLFNEGKPTHLFAHRRLRERPPSGGVSVLREAIKLPQPATDYALRIMQSARWNGVAMVEFKVDRRSKVPYLMEVNGRFWGSLQLAIDSGVDFPMLVYRQATSKIEITEQQPYRIGTRSRWWLGDLDHFLSRLRNTHADATLPSSTASLREVFLDLILPSGAKNEVLRLTDPRPGIAELIGYASSAKKFAVRNLRQRIRARVVKFSHRVGDVGLRFGLHEKRLRGQLPNPVTHVLVICKGNICRSPFVDQYLAKSAGRHKLSFEVSSAGLNAVSGKEAYPLAIAVSQNFDIELNHHRTTRVSERLVSKADIILVMEPSQRRQVIERFPSAKQKTFLLGHFVQKRPMTEIKDPYGGGEAMFHECFEVLSDACEGFLSHLEQASREYYIGDSGVNGESP